MMSRYRALLVAGCLAATAALACAQVPLTGAGRAGPAGGGGGYTGPGNVQPGAFAWWGFRAYDLTAATTHQNVVKLCGSTGLSGTCVTVTANTNGTITLPAAGACGSNCTLVATLYDQSRANNCSGPCDATQTTAANMPNLNTTGVISMLTQNGFGGLILSTSAAITLTQPYSLSSVASPVVASSSGGMLFMQNDSTGAGVGFNSVSAGVLINGNISGAFQSTNSATQAVYTTLQFLISNVASSSIIDLDGTNTLGTASSFTWAGDALSFTGPNSPNEVGLMEFGVWNSNISANFGALRTNQQAYCTSIGGAC